MRDHTSTQQYITRGFHSQFGLGIFEFSLFLVEKFLESAMFEIFQNSKSEAMRMLMFVRTRYGGFHKYQIDPSQQPTNPTELPMKTRPAKMSDAIPLFGTYNQA